MKTVNEYLTKASNLMAAGSFPSKAKQKEVFETLAHIYDRHIKKDIENGWDFFYVNKKAPVDLHNVKERHFAEFGDNADLVKLIVEMRADAKAMEIIKRPVADKAEERAMSVLPTKSGKLDAETLRKAAAAWRNITADELLEFTPSFQIDVTVHEVLNYCGTWFYRRMFFRDGKREAFASIMADYNRELTIWLAGRVA